MSGQSVFDAGFAEPSIPRENGSPVFAAPWQGRALALAVLTIERSGCTWDDFRQHLIACIETAPDRDYWESWVAALDQFLVDRQLVA